MIFEYLNIPILDLNHNNYYYTHLNQQLEQQQQTSPLSSLSPSLSQSITISSPISQYSNASIDTVIETNPPTQSPLEIIINTNHNNNKVLKILQSDTTYYIYISTVIIIQTLFMFIFVFLTIFYEKRILVYIFGYIGVSVRYFLSSYLNNKTSKIPYGSLISNIGATIIMSTTDSFVVY